jgi:hypothetical protein
MIIKFLFKIMSKNKQTNTLTKTKLAISEKIIVSILMISSLSLAFSFVGMLRFELPVPEKPIPVRCDRDQDGYDATAITSYNVCHGSDCNDLNFDINPGVSELCYNGIDDNCNDLENEGCGPDEAGVLIGSQDFENGDTWKTEFTGQGTWGDHVVAIDNDCLEGQYCLRWNQDKHRVDPITGLLGEGSPTLDWRADRDIGVNTPDEMFFSMDFRHDDYNNDAPRVARKLLYFIDEQYNHTAMYMAGQLGTNTPKLTYNNGAPYSSQWARDNWGYTSMYLTNPNVDPTLDGEWRKFEVYFNYNEKYVQIWFDGYLMLPGTGSNEDYWSLYPELAAEGKIIWDPTLDLHYEGFQLFYYDSDRDLENEVDQTGYYAGVQVDNLEVWDGLPPDKL